MPTVPPDALTTRQKVKDYLGIVDAGTDAIIDELITYCTQFIKSYCGGRQFLNQTFDEQYDSYRTRTKIFLKNFPITSTQQNLVLYYRSGTPTAVQWIVYNADSYLLYQKEGYIHFYSKLPEVHLGFRVVYNAGYLIDFTQEFDPAHHTLPEDLTLVATELCAKQFNTRKSAGILQETTEGQSVAYSYKARELDDMHRNILNSYKAFRIAK